MGQRQKGDRLPPWMARPGFAVTMTVGKVLGFGLVFGCHLATWREATPPAFSLWWLYVPGCVLMLGGIVGAELAARARRGQAEHRARVDSAVDEMMEIHDAAFRRLAD